IELGMDAVSAQGYNIAAMIIFVSSRFICTFLMRFVSPGGLLMRLAVLGGVLIAVLILVGGQIGLVALVGTSACMSLMFPTIYGIALEGLGDDAKFASAGLIMAILGGSIMPPMQAALIDLESIGGYSAVRISFVMPLICFAVIARFGKRSL
ncbi:MAG: MFS transporter, partial [Bacteroidetes Order II. Incertae sedis bacterium]|nr:MFS transporter [Bacteroidetes Order II. bacterium]